eukprot:5982669-Pyramimonas_sp.AAC.1
MSPRIPSVPSWPTPVERSRGCPWHGGGADGCSQSCPLLRPGQRAAPPVTSGPAHAAPSPAAARSPGRAPMATPRPAAGPTAARRPAALGAPTGTTDDNLADTSLAVIVAAAAEVPIVVAAQRTRAEPRMLRQSMIWTC